MIWCPYISLPVRLDAGCELPPTTTTTYEYIYTYLTLTARIAKSAHCWIRRQDDGHDGEMTTMAPPVSNATRLISGRIRDVFRSAFWCYYLAVRDSGPFVRGQSTLTTSLGVERVHATTMCGRYCWLLSSRRLGPPGDDQGEFVTSLSTCCCLSLPPRPNFSRARHLSGPLSGPDFGCA